MNESISYEKNRKISGKWNQFTFDQAMNGAISRELNNIYESNPNIDTLVGISAHNKEDGFNYFIGWWDSQGNETIPEGNFLRINQFDEAYLVYEKLANQHSYQSLFESSFDFDPIPCKIEFYKKADGILKCVEIEVPINKQSTEVQD